MRIVSRNIKNNTKNLPGFAKKGSTGPNIFPSSQEKMPQLVGSPGGFSIFGSLAATFVKSWRDFPGRMVFLMVKIVVNGW
jgi:hypothetical protein